MGRYCPTGLLSVTNWSPGTTWMILPIASALAEARLINISSDGTSAADGATNNITSVIQTVLAAQLVSKSGIGEGK